jgi:hypothetical protein
VYHPCTPAPWTPAPDLRKRSPRQSPNETKHNLMSGRAGTSQTLRMLRIKRVEFGDISLPLMGDCHARYQGGRCCGRKAKAVVAGIVLSSNHGLTGQLTSLALVSKKSIPYSAANARPSSSETAAPPTTTGEATFREAEAQRIVLKARKTRQACWPATVIRPAPCCAHTSALPLLQARLFHHRSGCGSESSSLTPLIDEVGLVPDKDGHGVHIRVLPHVGHPPPHRDERAAAGMASHESEK